MSAAKMRRLHPEKELRGVLLDITGVLVESSAEGDGVAIQGSVEAVKRLEDEGVPFRLVTNETQKTRKALVEKLGRLGFKVPEDKVFNPGLAMAAVIREKKLKPFLLVHPNCLPDFPEETVKLNSDNPEGVSAFDSVVLGDAVDGFSYKNINRAFRILDSCDPGAPLFSLGKGKYYREDGELTLDVGPFAAALEFATGKEAQIVGKPSARFFESALGDMGLSASEAVMVGDDVVSDVGGAQRCGMQGILVRTGKFRAADEKRDDVVPAAVQDNLGEAIKKLLPPK